MKFTITRTSQCFTHKQPCEQVHQEGLDEFGYPKWVVNIESLEDLCSFIDGVGEIVMGSDYIEIYDTYRE